MRWYLVLVVVLLACAGGNRRVDGADRPHILFAIADDWSYGHAGAYGCSWVDTAAFDRVAREGLLFTRAYTPNAKCAPSRACILAGRNSWQLKDACNHICLFPPEFRSFPEALAAQGYVLGSTGKGWGPGIAKDADGQLRQMVGRPFNQRKAKPAARAVSNIDYAANFGEFLKSVPGDQPWCFWLGTLEPHRGYQYQVGLAQGKKRGDIDHVPAFWPDTETVRNDMLDYAVEVEQFDRHLGRVLDQLEQAGQLDNTLVIVTSDHGMPFPRCKGQAYDYSNHVPLAIRWPRGIRQAGRRVESYVSFIDFAPTILAAAGVSAEQSGMAPMSGLPLQPVFADPARSHRDHVLIGKERHDIGRPHDGGYPIRGIVKGDMLYIRNFATDRWPAGNPITGYLNCDGSPTKTVVLEGRHDPAQHRYWQLCFGKRPAEELYDLQTDPDCIRNLAADETFQATRQQLAEQMTARLKGEQDPRLLGNGDYFDTIFYTADATRNFYERYRAGEKLQAGWVNASDFQERDD